MLTMSKLLHAKESALFDGVEQLAHCSFSSYRFYRLGLYGCRVCDKSTVLASKDLAFA